MFTTKTLLALAGSAMILAGPAVPLRVLRVSPTGDVLPTTTITITFDRPVAGSLDRSVDPRSIVRTSPTIPGRIEWRDPVTLVLTPRSALTSGARYSVIIANSFKAMDGSALAKPYTFNFRVLGPRPVAGFPVTPQDMARYVTPNPTLEVVYSSGVDAAKLADASKIVFGSTCAGAREIRLTAGAQRRVTAKDPYTYRSGAQRGSDTVRRAIKLVPAQPLPLDCLGELVLPAELAEGRTGSVRWPFRTYGLFRLDTARCEEGPYCPTGSVRLIFSTPVKGAEVLRHVTLLPGVAFTVRDSARESIAWELEAPLKPRMRYAVVVDSAMRDVFGQRLQGNPAASVATTGYAPSIEYPYGRLLVERNGFGTLAVQHINVDTLVASIVPIPARLEARFLARSPWSLGTLWDSTLEASAVVRRIAVRAAVDKAMITGLKIPAGDATKAGAPTLYAVRVTSAKRDTTADNDRATIALVQVTDLGVHAKVGVHSGVVWVTGVSDGKPRPGATVTLYDATGKTAATATTGADGTAQLRGYGAVKIEADTAASSDDEEGGGSSFEGFVAATLGADRAVVGISDYDPDLSPWHFNVSSASEVDRLEVSGAVFTERGIYRPGEKLYAKAIVRTGSLGTLVPPARGDSVKWIFKKQPEGEDAAETLLERVATVSAFGTADVAFDIPGDVSVGTQELEVDGWRDGRWVRLASTEYKVAEYRPPEFLVDLSADTSASHFPGETVRATVGARYLFGAPMGRAAMAWQARATPVSSWALQIPNTDGYTIGESGWWWEDQPGRHQSVDVFASGIDTLDATGHRALRVKLPDAEKGRAAVVTISATVTDVNRQASGASQSVTVHPASFYIGAKPLGKNYFWTVGTPQEIGLVTVTPSGERMAGVTVRGVVVRREWHQVQRERNGSADTVGEWVMDTVARCTVTTAAAGDAARCAITPKAGGTYFVTFRAKDPKGRTVVTTLYRWAVGTDWVPWNDESKFKMDVIPDRTRYAVGDTATVLIASPFTDAEAWITVEREGLIEQRRMKLSSGSTSLKFPITEAYTPNVFIGVFVARGRRAPPSTLEDPGRPTVRVGYAELRVTPEVKRLTVDVQALAPEYKPGDSARVRVQVRDQRGAGARSEVTLWAVDQGVLALTGYKTPDPIDLLYAPRGLGLRLASNLVSVAPQIPEGEKGRRDPGGGGGAGNADIMRSQFRATAFWLGSVVTDASGDVTVAAKLPDNLTTFRVMAVAVTQGDRYGSGQSSMLVSRPLVARPALPRIVRAGDDFTAGTVVNVRTGGTPSVQVTASATGVELKGDATQTAALEAGRGREVRFPFRAVPATLPRDSVTFRFRATSGAGADAVQLRIPVKPDYHPVAYTIAGAVRDTATAEFILPSDLDPARSTIDLNLGGSPMAIVKGAYRWLHVYPYYCTEQVTSTGTPIIALWRAQKTMGTSTPTGVDPKREVETAVAILARRQRSDGGIGYWGNTDWTTPWLSAYAGAFLLDAKAMGVVVNDSVIARLSRYLGESLNSAERPVVTPVANWYERRYVWLGDKVAAADFLSRTGHADVPAENRLIAGAAQMAQEDRIRLAVVVARRGAQQASLGLIAPSWAAVKLEGRRAILPDSTPFYFESHLRPTARLLSATLAINPTHPLIGPLVETLVQQGRSSSARSAWLWNTQDLSFVVSALSDFEQQRKGDASRSVSVSSGGRVVLRAQSGKGTSDTLVSLAGLVVPRADGTKSLKLSLGSSGAAGGTGYYYLTVHAVPVQRPVTPVDSGIVIERWYEKYESSKPVTSVAEGDLVRVRLRIKVPNDRQFFVLDDPLPGGLEAVDLSLRTAAPLPGPGRVQEGEQEEPSDSTSSAYGRWYYGSWDSGWWSPFDHRELRDDRVVYYATYLFRGTYTATYIARATTPGVFTRPPAHAEEMYNAAVFGRSDGGVFTVTARTKP
ncbi:MAG: alpha-2-macroglobulin family protein [Gemmatimonadaceae bacterium]